MKVSPFIGTLVFLHLMSLSFSLKCWICSGGGGRNSCLNDMTRLNAVQMEDPRFSYCVTMRQEKNGMVEFFVRGGYSYNPGNSCSSVDSAAVRICWTSCRSDLCNDGVGVPQGFSVAYRHAEMLNLTENVAVTVVQEKFYSETTLTEATEKPGLYCHMCTTSVENSWCEMNVSHTQVLECKREFCYVVREEWAETGQLVRFQRSCENRDFGEGCSEYEHWGPDGFEGNIRTCFQTCSDNYCNTGLAKYDAFGEIVQNSEIIFKNGLSIAPNMLISLLYFLVTLFCGHVLL